MVNPEIISEWLAKAEEDFQFARLNLEDQQGFYSQICFHFEQAVEKYLKAFIVAHELEFRKTHDLSLLLKICITKDAAFKSILEDCENLNSFYVETRYPVHWPTRFSHEHAMQAYESASRVRALITKKLSP